MTWSRRQRTSLYRSGAERVRHLWKVVYSSKPLSSDVATFQTLCFLLFEEMSSLPQPVTTRHHSATMAPLVASYMIASSTLLVANKWALELFPYRNLLMLTQFLASFFVVYLMGPVLGRVETGAALSCFGESIRVAWCCLGPPSPGPATLVEGRSPADGQDSALAMTSRPIFPPLAFARALAMHSIPPRPSFPDAQTDAQSNLVVRSRRRSAGVGQNHSLYPHCDHLLLRHLGEHDGSRHHVC